MDETPPVATGKMVFVRMLTVVLATFFLLAGSIKLDPSPEAVVRFVRWGYPEWFLYLVGAMEMGGAIALLIPRVAGVGALLLGVIMVGATLTHLLHDEMAAVPVPLVLLALLAFVVYVKRDAVLALIWHFTKK